MSDETLSSPSPAPSAPARPPKKRRGWLAVAWLILLLALAGSAGAGYVLWQQLQESRAALLAQIQETQGHYQDLHGQLQEVRAQFGGELQARLRALDDAQKRLEANIGDLYAKQRRVGDSEEQGLVEAAYLLRVASQRLALGQDVQAALAALVAADERFKHVGDPRVIPVREQLAKDINRLKELDLPDVNGMALRLQDYLERVDGLPLLQGRQQAEAPGERAARERAAPQGWRELPGAVWDELRQLVVIRYNSAADPGLLAPEQRYFLTQNLRLKLESARFALLRHDTPQFQAALGAALAWLERYYDQGAAEVKSLREELGHMREVALAPSLPDISLALTLLQQLGAAPAEGGGASGEAREGGT